MPARHKTAAGFDFQHAGFSAFSGRPNPALGHRHNEVELAVFEHGSLVAMYNGRPTTVRPNCLVVLWGAMPHRALRLEGPTIGCGIRVPLPWVLQWKLPDAFVHRLLNFDVVVDSERESPCSDLAQIGNWVRLMQNHQPESREIVLLEIHARLLRLAMEAPGATRKHTGGPVAHPSCGFGLFERILQIVSERYLEPLRIPEIARALHISRTHVMRQFRKTTGMSVLEYITQRRVSHAQRLLATTDRKTIDIAYESGFSAPGRFHACFKRLVGQTPAHYRKSLIIR